MTILSPPQSAPTLTPQTVVSWIRQFAADRPDFARQISPRGIHDEIRGALGGLGLFGLLSPREAGGLGLGEADALEVLEQCGAIDLTTAALLVPHATATRAIAEQGTGAARRRWQGLPSGEQLAAFALTEAAAGSNPREIATRAIRTDGGWRLEGKKTWCGAAAFASVLVVFARTNQGLTAFAMPARAPGVSIGKAYEKHGTERLGNHTVTLHGVELDGADMIGEPGQGMQIAQRALGFGRLAATAIALGAARRAVQWTARYGARRQIATGVLGEHPALQSAVADSLFGIAAISSLLERATGVEDSTIEMLCKVAATEHLWLTADTAVQLLGARGLDRSNPLADLLADCRFLRIGEGPTETLQAQAGATWLAKTPALRDTLGSALRARLDADVDRLRHHDKRSESTPPRWLASATGQLLVFAALADAATRAADSEAAAWAERGYAARLATLTGQHAVRSWEAALEPRLAAQTDAVGALDLCSAAWPALDPLLAEREPDGRRTNALSTLSDEQLTRALLLGRGAQTEDTAECPETRVAASLASRPHEIVIRAADGEALDARTVERRANALAHRLVEQGVGEGTFVALVMPRCAELVVGAYAVLKAGGAFAPIDPTLPAAALRGLFDRLQPRVAVTTSPAAPLPAGLESLVMDAVERTTGPISRATPDSPAYVMFTSGSTGTPRGVICTRAAWNNTLAARHRLAPLQHDDRVLAVSVPTFDPALLEWFGPLIAGAELVFPAVAAGLWNTEHFDELLSRHDITVMQLVPSQLVSLLRRPRQQPHRLRLLFVGGERLSGELVIQAERALGATVYNVYGPTEAAIEVCAHRCSPASGPLPPIGRPMANAHLYVLDESGQFVAPGDSGELHIGGDQLALGYLDDPEHTAEKFVPDPFREQSMARMFKTGDRVRWRDDGELEFLGRVDRMLKIHGRRLEPAEVESVLLAHPQVARAALVVREARGGRSQLVAFVEAVAGTQPATEGLRAFAAEHLPRQLVPSLQILTELPRTPNGKIDHRALPQFTPPLAVRAELSVSADDRRVVELWQRMLGAELIDLDDDFFLAGGDSLSAIELLAEIGDAFGLAVHQQDFFAEPTARTLCRLVSEARTRATHEVVKATWHDADRDRDVPLLAYLPKGAGPHPVVVFSHGLGGNREGYAYLGRSWAERGFLAVHVQHQGSDTETLLEQPNASLTAMRVTADRDGLADRPLDVRFLLDEMARRRGELAWVATAQLERVAVAGHSFGAFTALALGGLCVDLPDQPAASFRDPRVVASIALCPPADLGGAVVPEHYASVAVPSLHCTGTEDDGPLFKISPAARRLPFDSCRKSVDATWFVNLTGADHFAFADNPYWQGQPVRRDPRHHPMIRALTSDFLDVYLRDHSADVFTDHLARLGDAGEEVDGGNTPLARASS